MLMSLPFPMMLAVANVFPPSKVAATSLEAMKQLALAALVWTVLAKRH